MEEHNDKAKCSSRKRLRKPKRLEFVGWGSRNLIEFLQSLGRDTTNMIPEKDVTSIIMNYIREKNRENPSSNSKTRRKTVTCDEKLRLLFETRKINIIKVPDLVEKHYVENQDDEAEFGFLFDSDDDNEQQRLSLSDKIDKQVKEVVPQRPKGTFAAIVRDNIKLLFLRKSLVQELAKTPETFESKMVGTFVRIKNPCQLVQVTGVKDGNPIDGHFLQVANYSYHLEDVPSSILSDDDFSPEECEELHQRIKNGCVKRLTVLDMEEKVRSLHEDVTKHWIARELALLQRRINQANEKGWRRELSQYLEKRELLTNPEEQSRLLCEVPEVVAEELEPQCVDDGVKIEDDFMEPNPVAYIEAHQSDDEEQRPSDSPVHSVQKNLENDFMESNSVTFVEAHQSDDEEQQPSDSPVDTVQKNLENDFMESNSVTFVEAHQSDGEEQQPSDSPVHSVQKNLENDFMESNSVTFVEAHQSEEEQQPSDSPVDTVQKNLENSKLRDGEDQPSRAASADDKDLHEDVEEQPENGIITENKDTIYDHVPQAQSNPVEIIELSDDDDEDNDNDNGDYEQCDPKKVMWCYEQPKGRTNGPFSLAQLKEWNDEEYFVQVPDFKVWMTGKGMRSAVLLTKLVHHIKA